jgi:hypothetical protein
MTLYKKLFAGKPSLSDVFELVMPLARSRIAMRLQPLSGGGKYLADTTIGYRSISHLSQANSTPWVKK